MAVKTILYSYKLECGHDAQARLIWFQKREPNEPIAYHKDDSVKCQPCKYRMRKIISETKTILEE
jgi:hypothetical protein